MRTLRSLTKLSLAVALRVLGVCRPRLFSILIARATYPLAPSAYPLALVMAVSILLTGGVARGAVPSVAEVDAEARAAGNRIDVATAIGERIFSTAWSAQVSQVSANAVDAHLIVGIRVWGVKFHRPMTRAQFVNEVDALVDRAFAAAPTAEEVDLWASVPIEVGKGVVVSGDLAKPTTRTVFSVSVRHGESAATILARASARTNVVFWDPDWERTAFL